MNSFRKQPACHTIHFLFNRGNHICHAEFTFQAAVASQLPLLLHPGYCFCCIPATTAVASQLSLLLHPSYRCCCTPATAFVASQPPLLLQPSYHCCCSPATAAVVHLYPSYTAANVLQLQLLMYCSYSCSSTQATAANVPYYNHCCICTLQLQLLLYRLPVQVPTSVYFDLVWLHWPSYTVDLTLQWTSIYTSTHTTVKPFTHYRARQHSDIPM